MADKIQRRKTLCHVSPQTFSTISLSEVFFITICAQERGENQFAKPDVWQTLMESVLNRNKRGTWNCSLFLAMPDHIHMLVSFDGKVRMASAIAQWKRWVSSQTDVKWQRDFFDHRLRDFESAAAKSRYIALNPVRASLAENASEWPYFWKRPTLQIRVL